LLTIVGLLAILVTGIAGELGKTAAILWLGSMGLAICLLALLINWKHNRKLKRGVYSSIYGGKAFGAMKLMEEDDD
jgi:hypothetical protein